MVRHYCQVRKELAQCWYQEDQQLQEQQGIQLYPVQQMEHLEQQQWMHRRHMQDVQRQLVLRGLYLSLIHISEPTRPY